MSPPADSSAAVASDPAAPTAVLLWLLLPRLLLSLLLFPLLGTN